MDNKKVWIVENADGKMVVCSTEGSAYRKALQHYIDLMEESLAEIKKRTDVDDANNVEHVYKTIICDLKTLAQEHYMEYTIYMWEAELAD
jgi:hypothetical protein